MCEAGPAAAPVVHCTPAPFPPTCLTHPLLATHPSPLPHRASTNTPRQVADAIIARLEKVFPGLTANVMFKCAGLAAWEEAGGRLCAAAGRAGQHEARSLSVARRPS